MRDSRLPPGVAQAIGRSETVWVCDHPRALPPAGSPTADWVVVPIAFAWLYPDSLLLLEALDFARRGLVLHGELADGAALRRLNALLASLRLGAVCVDQSGAKVEAIDVSTSVVVRAER